MLAASRVKFRGRLYVGTCLGRLAIVLGAWEVKCCLDDAVAEVTISRTGAPEALSPTLPGVPEASAGRGLEFRQETAH